LPLNIETKNNSKQGELRQRLCVRTPTHCTGWKESYYYIKKRKSKRPKEKVIGKKKKSNREK
jgi:hypothetical protein